MHRVGGHFGTVKVEHLRQNLERKAGRYTRHALVHACVVAVLLVALGARVGVFQALAVVHLHLAEDAGVLGLLQPREDGELRHHLERARRAHGVAQRRLADEFFVDAGLFAHAQAVRHLDDVDAVQKRLVVLVVAKCLPLALVAVRQHHAVKRNGAKALRALVVALLRGREQRVQHLDGRLEHLDKFEQALVGQAEASAVTVGVGVVLRKGF
ncbi:hypothetical protein D3C71_796040 [compost metagenome]